MKKIAITLALVMSAILGITAYAIGYQQPAEKPINLTQMLDVREDFAIHYQPNRDSYGMGQFSKVEYNDTCLFEKRQEANRLEACTLGSKKYNYNIRDVFVNLPEIPEDFYWIKYKMMDEHFVDICTLDDSYWRQPEFIADTFTDAGMRYYKSPRVGYWTPSGFGSFPAIQWATANAGDTITLCFLWYTGFGVITQQGFQLVPTYLETVFSPQENLYYDAYDPETSGKYIKVTVDPTTFLMKEAYPIFNYDWLKRIVVTVKIAPDAPAGDYGIGINPINPPTATISKWQSEYPLYQKIGWTTTGFPQFQSLITVRGPQNATM